MISQRNRLDSLIKNTRKAMAEFGKSLPLEQQKEINGVLNEADESFESGGSDKIQDALTKVEETANQLTESLMATV